MEQLKMARDSEGAGVGVVSAPIMEAILQLRRAVIAATGDLPLGLAVTLPKDAGDALVREAEMMVGRAFAPSGNGDGMLKAQVCGIPVVWPDDRAAVLAEEMAAERDYRRMRESMEAGR